MFNSKDWNHDHNSEQWKEIKNVKLYKHPNPNSSKTAYIVTRTYTDHQDSFADKVYKNWKFDKNDKRKIKKIKKRKWNK